MLLSPSCFLSPSCLPYCRRWSRPVSKLVFQATTDKHFLSPFIRQISHSPALLFTYTSSSMNGWMVFQRGHVNTLHNLLLLLLLKPFTLKLPKSKSKAISYYWINVISSHSATLLNSLSSHLQLRNPHRTAESSVCTTE